MNTNFTLQNGMEISISKVKSVSPVTQREYGTGRKRIKDYIVYVRTHDGASFDGVITRAYNHAENFKNSIRKALEEYEVEVKRHRVIENRYPLENLERLANANKSYDIGLLKRVRKERLQSV